MTDKQLKLAVHQAAGSLDTLWLPEQQISLSAGFQQAVLTRIRSSKQSAVKRFSRLVACLLLALLLTGSTVLFLSPQVRAAVRGWFVREVPDRVRYKVDGSNTHIPDYRLGYMPEGFSSALPVEDGASVTIRYFGLEGRKAQFLAVRNNWLYQNALELESGGVQPKIKRVRLKNGMADYYTVKDGRDAALVWYNQDRTTVFCITGPFTDKTMQKIAESLYTEGEGKTE